MSKSIKVMLKISQLHIGAVTGMFNDWIKPAFMFISPNIKICRVLSNLVVLLGVWRFYIHCRKLQVGILAACL